MPHKYDVHISFSTDGERGLTLNGNRIFKNKIKKYIYDISDMNMIPKESCIHRIGVCFNDITTMQTSLSQDPEQSVYPIESYMGGLDINILRKHKCKCSQYQCCYNLVTGECTDPFMIDIVGKKFFPDKYKTIRTKQR